MDQALDPPGARAFRFFDNREKYLLFVTTCSEKWAVAERVGREVKYIRPQQPAIRLFDAGVGDASVLTLVMREIHSRFPTIPMLVVGKEVSLEDVRLTLDKMADRFSEHPATVFVVTNMYYSEAPLLRPRDPAAADRINWYDVPLSGTTAHEFDEQIKSLQPQLAEGWQTRTSEKTGNPLYVNPSVMVLYREDHRFILDRVLPRPDGVEGEYDLVIASQPYRARQPAEFKVNKVLAPLARSLGKDGRMVVIQSTGRDPGMEIIRRIWPDEDPFSTPAHLLVDTLRMQISADVPDLRYEENPAEGALFRFRLHAMPNELGDNIGTSTLLAAWNAAVYVAQIDDGRLTEAMTQGEFLEVTSDVLRRNGGLWFLDEVFVVHR